MLRHKYHFYWWAFQFWVSLGFSEIFLNLKWKNRFLNRQMFESFFPPHFKNIQCQFWTWWKKKKLPSFIFNAKSALCQWKIIQINRLFLASGLFNLCILHQLDIKEIGKILNLRYMCTIHWIHNSISLFFLNFFIYVMVL